MATHLGRAPHAEPLRTASVEAPNAALLIDFDNVTMGMRSDLAKELKNLLNSDIIKGKVTVQRAYADWRRYPQYIVPLSEASIDLIFAPAYGSSKKNATDIRMAIDGMELVFIRPEIGTYILLTGDSDFSSLVLKLKEYGKYVVGIGIQESSSDILVQNCDEYYSYTTLTGLTKTTDLDAVTLDPWECVTEAVGRMADRGDVMRSDRLKQVMLELSPNFDEANLGHKKFSKFLIEAANKGLLTVRRGENGQYEVGPVSGSERKAAPEPRSRSRSRSGGRSEEGSRSGGRSRGRREPQAAAVPAAGSEQAVADGLSILKTTMERLKADGKERVRDSDVKRKILSIDSDFNEMPLGFPKFSRFLLYAEEQGVISLERLETGNYQVRLAENSEAQADGDSSPSESPDVDAAGAVPTSSGSSQAAPPDVAEPAPSDDPDRSAPKVESKPSFGGALGLRSLFGRLGPRRGERPRGEVPVVVDPAQTRTPSVAPRETRSSDPAREAAGAPKAESVAQSSGEPVATSPVAGAIDSKALGLPTTSESMVSYLANRYRGVGQKTAESLVETFGPDTFTVLHTAPEKVRRLVGDSRAEQVLSGWGEDHARRSQAASASGAGRGGA